MFNLNNSNLFFYEQILRFNRFYFFKNEKLDSLISLCRIRISMKYIFLVLFIINILSCSSSKDSDKSEEIDGGKFETIDNVPKDRKPENSPFENHFSNKDCNRVYWTFKCTLEFKKTKTHSQECLKKNESIVKQIEMQSKNSEQIIRHTWQSFFNKNCQNDLKVKPYLENLN